MSDEALDGAVEKILADPNYAKRVLQNPEWALSQFCLEPGEWRAIHWSLMEDVLEAVDFSQIKYNYLGQLPKLKGGIDRASGDPTAHARLAR